MTIEFQRIQRVAADILKIPPEQITPSSCKEDIPTWNSVRFLSLVLALEEEFGVVLEPEEFDIKTLGQLVATLEVKLQKNGH